MPKSRRRGERLFRVLGGAAIALLISGASLGIGWEAFAGTVPEPGWMVRVSAAVWFAALVLTGVAVAVSFSGRRDCDG
jgi:hypothetical protein